ncbi:MAG: YCF48-related protein [Ignavibacteriaceae bacterium]
MLLKIYLYIAIVFIIRCIPQEYSLDAYTDIFVYDSAYVWAVTYNGNIWKSTDNGLSWTITDTQIDTVWKIWFTDLSNGWILTNRKVYSTVNGGQNWTSNFEPDSINFRDLLFVSDSVGFVVGSMEENSRIFRTTDFGNNWDVVLDSSNIGLFRLGMKNEDLIWIVGASRVVYYTNDLGDNWKTIYKAPNYVGFYLFQAQLFDDFTGIIGDGVDQIVIEGFLKFTTNGGLNWLQYGSNVNLMFGIGDFYFLSLNEGWVSNGNRDIFYTNNSGLTWNTLQDHTSLPNSIREFYFLDNHNAWGLTYQDIIQTIDGWHTIIVKGTLSDVEQIDSKPEKFLLYQNYPNPFNPTTKIKFEIPGQARNGITLVTLKVYDILGREIANLVNEEKPAGSYEVNFDGTNFTSGVYFYTLTAGDFSSTKKLVLLK